MNVYPRPSFPHLARAMRARTWQRCRPHLTALAAFLFTLLYCRFCFAVEVPDSIIRGLVMVESGCEWRDTGDIRGKWSIGADAEVSPFQLSHAALSDMGVTNHARVHRDTVYAESLARLWLARCYAKAGNRPDAVARYNAGSRYRSRTARDYSARVLALASVL
jgi:hypothetical protein